MSFMDTLKKNLTPELFGQITDALGDDFDYDMVPRTRLNKVIAQRNALKEQVGNPTNSASSKSKKSAEDYDDEDDSKGGTPSNGLTQKDLDDAVNAAKLEAQKSLDSMKVQYAVLDKLRGAKALDPDLIIKSDLLKTSEMKFEEDGSIKGLDEAIKQLTTDKTYLFDTGATGTGKDGDEGKGGSGDSQQSQIDAVFASNGVFTSTDVKE